jgi:metal transporter CNNM
LFATGVEPFHNKFISAHILSRLLNVDLYKEFEFDEDESKTGKVTYIYEYGKPVDYFVLIVNGKAELETGKEKIVSEVGSFSYFGVSALYVRRTCSFCCVRDRTRLFVVDSRIRTRKLTISFV